MVVSSAIAGAAFGYSLLSWVGAILGLIFGAGLMAQYVIRNRYYR